MCTMGFPGDLVVKNPPAMQEIWVRSLGQEVPLEEEMATHSSVLALLINYIIWKGYYYFIIFLNLWLEYGVESILFE